MAGAVVRLVERVNAPFAGCRVDREKGIIHGAKICGLASENGYDYDPASFGAGKSYGGRHSYLNHGRGERRAEDKIGWWPEEHITVGPDGPRGDFHVLLSHPAAMILEAAERNPSMFGFSHVADCEMGKGAGGRKCVTRVEKVASIDLVAEPATTKSLFESKGGGVATITVKEFAGRVGPKLGPAKWGALTKLLEDLGMGDSVSMDAPADDAGAEQSTEEAVDALGVAILKDTGLSDDEKIAKLKALFRAKKTILGAGDGGGEAPAEESRQAAEATAVREAIETCRKVGFKGFDADDLDLIAAAPKARWEAVAKRLMGSGGGEERPTSGDRSGVAGVRRESKGGAKAPEADRFVWID